jgi:hypothetical protein
MLNSQKMQMEECYSNDVVNKVAKGYHPCHASIALLFAASRGVWARDQTHGSGSALVETASRMI